MTEQIIEPYKYMSVSAIARRWAVSRSVVYELIRMGLLVGLKIGRQYRIERASVINYEMKRALL